MYWADNITPRVKKKLCNNRWILLRCPFLPPNRSHLPIFSFSLWIHIEHMIWGHREGSRKKRYMNSRAERTHSGMRNELKMIQLKISREKEITREVQGKKVCWFLLLLLSARICFWPPVKWTRLFGSRVRANAWKTW